MINNSIKTLFLFLCSYNFLSVSNSQAQTVYPLWNNGAPGFEHRKDEPEHAKDWWVKNIHHPSITLYEPDQPNGAAILIIPGGGHRELVYNSEGERAARYLTNLGFKAFVLKYRLVREEGSEYTFEHVRQDGIRAMKRIRGLSEELGFDPNRVGILAFSAGGEVAAMLAFEENDDREGSDEIDQFSFRPDFLVQVYPGPLFIPSISVPEDAPPAFLVASNNDVCCSETIVQLLRVYRAAGKSVEMHLYAKGDHAFNMGTRSDLKTISGWPERMKEWFEDHDFFQ
ncbi:MAG: alpha/beta hydrolase [Cytophagales bacterium]|nr:alpha/beta hydrolase [Cytophagales bacterium]